jgi:hypothetical protein
MNKNKTICTECNNPIDFHVVFCSQASPERFREFCFSELKKSMKAVWTNEREFKEITDQYLNDPALSHYSEFERRYKAGQSAARKLAASNCTYYMSRATMFATALDATGGLCEDEL